MGRRHVMTTLALAGALVHCSSSEEPASQPAPSPDGGGLDATVVRPDGGGDAGPSSPDGGTSAAPLALAGDITRPTSVSADTPLPGVVALSLDPSTGAASLAAHVKGLVERISKGETIPGFPVAAESGDRVRAIPGVRASLVAKWFDPLSSQANGPRFGGNADYLAYFGDGWDATAGDPPQWHGSGSEGWLWVNHEYVSGNVPSVGTGGVGLAPNNQNLVLARFLGGQGTLPSGDVAAGTFWTQATLDTFIVASKREVGGSWIRIRQDAASGAWSVDKTATNRRFDSTSNTLAKVTGITLSADDHTDDGTALPTGVVAGITSDCSGGQTPWGTVLSGEENVQFAWGDIEICWDGSNALRAGKGCDAGGNITFAFDPSGSSLGFYGQHSVTAQRHRPDFNNYLAEIDPTAATTEYLGKTTAGVGHRKLGALGRARWENGTFAVDASWKLAVGKPVVLYAADDRVGGRIFKFVSSGNVTAGMSRPDTRALLDSGSVYVAHFAGLSNDGINLKATSTPPSQVAPGTGKWIRLALDNTTDDAPNASAAGHVGMKVGAALASSDYNRLGAFASDEDVRRVLFTAANKIGVMELNRPEDVEWNPKSPLTTPPGKPQIFVAFTKHTAKTALDADGLVFDPAPDAGVKSVARTDTVGRIFAMEEADSASPGTSMTFTFFQAWAGESSKKVGAAANPDNLLIDGDGGIWFGTDGNFDLAAHADAVYYLDLNPAHKAAAAGITVPTFGQAFRVMAVPSDAEATGPAMSSDQKTLFVSVQHPGESAAASRWPER